MKFQVFPGIWGVDLPTKRIKPDLIVKGGDYASDQVIGHDICDVEIFEYVDGYSTTSTIKNISDR